MAYWEFLWTNDIVEHIAEHDVSQDNFEYVFCNPTNRGYSRSSGLPAAWGHTADGRYIIIVYDELDEMTVLPITAYEVSEPR